MDVMNIAEREIIASDARAGTTMDHTSVTILVDAFAHQPAADTDAVIQTYKQGMETSGGIEIGDRTLRIPMEDAGGRPCNLEVGPRKISWIIETGPKHFKPVCTGHQIPG